MQPDRAQESTVGGVHDCELAARPLVPGVERQEDEGPRVGLGVGDREERNPALDAGVLAGREDGRRIVRSEGSQRDDSVAERGFGWVDRIGHGPSMARLALGAGSRRSTVRGRRREGGPVRGNRPAKEKCTAFAERRCPKWVRPHDGPGQSSPWCNSLHSPAPSRDRMHDLPRGYSAAFSPASGRWRIQCALPS